MDSAECTKVITNIRKNFKAYMIHSKLKCIVLGISGGIDSALCAALLKPICDDLSIPLIGVSLPSDSNKSEECDRADLIGNAFCAKYAIAPIIDSMVDLTYEAIGTITNDFEFNWDIPENEFKIYNGNLKARSRMIALYGLAGLYKGMVISTDNYTEYLLGFWTLHGDVGDYGPMQNLWKTEVYEIARSITISISMEGRDEEANALMACINAVPTDGLGITSSDLEQIGAKSYTQVDAILQNYLDGYLVNLDPIAQKVVDRHLNSKFKRSNPYNIPREYLFK